MRTARTALTAAALLIAIPLTLAGCSVADVLQKQTTGDVSSVADLQSAWRNPASEPTWIPADATRIRYIAGTAGPKDADPASVRVDTKSALPADCKEVPRRSLDSFGSDWAPKEFPDTVDACGNWAVVSVDGGYFAWTPLAPGEADGVVTTADTPSLTP